MTVTELFNDGKEADARVFAGAKERKSDTKLVEVLIHSRDVLDESAAGRVIEKLAQLSGVSDTHYNPTRNHLLIVSYNPHLVNPVQLLAVMHELGYQAQLVGL